MGKPRISARCGTYGVYENPDSKSGRVIALHLIVIPAKHPQHRAIAEIGGGPGQAATDFAPDLLSGGFGKTRIMLHDTYDYVMMDDRGMGQSYQFRCDFTPRGDPASYFRYLYPPAILAACRTSSAATHDLRWYNTNAAVDDLDNLRAALGYGKIVLDGGSYGTMFSLVYMRRHPAHVESAILDSVAPPGFQPLPGEPLGAQNALTDLFAKCSKNSACHKNFPLFEQHFQALMKRFDAGPVNVPAENLVTKNIETVALSKEVFVDSLRHVLYSPDASAYVPFMVERAYRGDYAPLGRIMQLVILSFSTTLNMGAWLNYACADMTPFISEAQVRYAAAHSFTGDLRIRAQQQACAAWNVAPMPASFNDPVRSGLPALMILGSDDPATPARYGLAALKYLPNARAVLVTGGGHGPDTPCTDALELQFVRAQSAKGLDVTKCSATFKLPPFATSLKSLPPVQ
ncbi:MAG TPA: alpha/beta hydrolase [Candidatus Baltobacteraceae bacterium]|nr:alpha/beta hydrolase [Candidatus Baltobacteraceae bacterium]